MDPPPISVGSGTLRGVDAVPVAIEVRLHGTTGTPRLLGLVGPAVREAYFRVLDALHAQGLPPPRGTPMVNFLPAGLRKDGVGFDLPLALALAAAAGALPPAACRGVAAYAEVSLRGRVMPADGAVSVALAARRRGWTVLLLHPRDAAAAALVPGVRAYGVESLGQAVAFLRGEAALLPAQPRPAASHDGDRVEDLADIRGHETPKWALAVAAAGRHDLLFVGPPGSGKSALVRRLPGLLPPLAPEEALEVLKIHLVRGAGAGGAARRPLRAPHHTSSFPAILGGGAAVRPGEVTLAQHGVLFLDELPEFRREVLEGLRQPLEDRQVTIGRAEQVVTMPADFQLAAAMNPCPCGHLGHRRRPCTCPPYARRRYLARLSGPLLDRIDLQVEVPALEPAELRAAPDPHWSTAALRARVLAAHARQRHRAHRAGWPPCANARLGVRTLERAVGADAAVLDAVDAVLAAYRMSGRARVRVLRIARTIADLDDRDRVTADDVVRAAELRSAVLGGE